MYIWHQLEINGHILILYYDKKINDSGSTADWITQRLFEDSVIFEFNFKYNFNSSSFESQIFNNILIYFKIRLFNDIVEIDQRADG